MGTGGRRGEILCFVLHLSKVCVWAGGGGGVDRVIEYFRQFPAFFVCVCFSFLFLLVPINFVIIVLSCGNLKRDLDKYSAVFYVTLT